MIITDLSYLEDSEVVSIAGGSCSISVSIINGKASIKTSIGCPPIKQKIETTKLKSGGQLVKASVTLKKSINSFVATATSSAFAEISSIISFD